MLPNFLNAPHNLLLFSTETANKTYVIENNTQLSIRHKKKCLEAIRALTIGKKVLKNKLQHLRREISGKT